MTSAGCTKTDDPDTVALANYAELLGKYRTFVQDFDRDADMESLTAGEFSRDWSGLCYNLYFYDSKEDFGYGLEDINQDGISELFLLTRHYTDDSEECLGVWNIYSFSGGAPQFICGFWNRSRKR